MSGSKFDWIFAVAADSEVSGAHKHIATVIALRNLDLKAPTFRVKQATVAVNCGTSIQTVKRAYDALRKRGWIELVERRGRQSGVDKYRLRFPDSINPGVTSGPSSPEPRYHQRATQVSPADLVGIKTDSVNSGNDDLKGFSPQGIREGTALGPVNDYAPASDNTGPPKGIPEKKNNNRLGPEPSEFCPEHRPTQDRSQNCCECRDAKAAKRDWHRTLDELFKAAMAEYRQTVDNCHGCNDRAWVLGPDGHPIDPVTNHHRRPKREDFHA